jgi:hypothetical protein
LNTNTKTATTTSLNRFDYFEADAMPTHFSVHSVLVRRQLLLPAGWPSSASAAH